MPLTWLLNLQVFQVSDMVSARGYDSVLSRSRRQSGTPLTPRRSSTSRVVLWPSQWTSSTSFANASNHEPLMRTNMKMTRRHLIESIAREAIEWRRELHRHPQTMYEEGFASEKRPCQAGRVPTRRGLEARLQDSVGRAPEIVETPLADKRLRATPAELR